MITENILVLSEEEIKEKILQKGNIPKHIAIIMDGNGRWAQKRGLPRSAGHQAGVKTVKRVVQAAGEIKVSILTLFTFSTENWERPKSEVAAIMKLLYDATRQEMKELEEKNVRLITTGRIDQLSFQRRNILKKAISRTKNNTGLVLNLALNYSGRMEIIDAVKKLAQDVKNNKIKSGQIDEKLFHDYLYTDGLPDPDLLIRTSGEMRLSNFLLWQAAYTELYVTEVLWPDFSEKDFYLAIWDYQTRERRFGKV
ncbi:MAG: undecaprenyl pyrophosphate synthase [candidate division Zixibacteria bacterium RBG-1]|nr:MAG: undecaprenyl pyrophosphate synthase [candidate division Zixibacteria bacterium RBG-1]OGC85730.1 MAG: di-trans,poly-cis-decaprenylcistransferase [candidate division Zixibacteria bacterium RBG_19FT_COMBO_42_43]